MRDHTKLRAFQLADDLAIKMYQLTQSFPKEEQYGLTAQMRRAAVSIACNIVEGCARSSQADYLHFLNIAYGSARELDYQLALALRLGFCRREHHGDIRRVCEETGRVLNGLIRSLRERR